MGEAHIHKVALDDAAAAADGAHVGTVVAIEIKLVQCLAKPREAVAQEHLVARHAWGEVLLGCFFVGATLVGQQVFREENEIDETGQGNEDAYLRELKHRHAVDPIAHQQARSAAFLNGNGLILGLLQEHAVEHEVGGCAYEGADTSDDRGV